MQRATADTDESTCVAGGLLDWFGTRDRNVPWRGETDPYAILVAEVMAQQTRIDTVAPYYRRFLRRFPDVRTLAGSSEGEVLKSWEGLGYYARARNLRRAAGQVMDAYDGSIPAEIDDLRSLAGVGPYTAGAVASLAFDRREPAIDGNARRVLSRLFDLEAPTPARLDRAARSLLAKTERPGALNQAIMDLGSEICLPRKPRCANCPVESACLALSRGTVAERPPTQKRLARPTRTEATAVIERRGTALIFRRPSNGLLGGLWDFPSFEMDDPSQATLPPTKIETELGLHVGTPEKLRIVRHVFSHFHLHLHVHRAPWRRGHPHPGREWHWATPEDLRDLAFPSYHRRLINVDLTPPNHSHAS